jgi:hypothetical protein
MKKSPDNPLAKLVDGALRQAAKKVVKRAEESGTPVIIWEDDRIRLVDPRNMRKRRNTEHRTPKAEN